MSCWTQWGKSGRRRRFKWITTALLRSLTRKNSSWTTRPISSCSTRTCRTLRCGKTSRTCAPRQFESSFLSSLSSKRKNNSKSLRSPSSTRNKWSARSTRISSTKKSAGLTLNSQISSWAYSTTWLPRSSRSPSLAFTCTSMVSWLRITSIA